MYVSRDNTAKSMHVQQQIFAENVQQISRYGKQNN